LISDAFIYAWLFDENCGKYGRVFYVIETVFSTVKLNEKFIRKTKIW
jgi:hypothetical protein